MGVILGIDVGATGIKGNLVDTETGDCLKDRFKILTPEHSTPENVLKVVKEIIKHFDWKGKPLGMCFPAVVTNGKTLTATNISDEWIQFDAFTFFKDNLQCDFTIINDADAAGISEMSLGQGKDNLSKVLILTLGTGIGSALFYNGKLIPNIELGHLKWKDDVVEKYASSSARKIKNLDYDEWGQELNDVLTHIEFIIRPNKIILGGGVSRKFDLYEEQLSGITCELVPASLKNEAGIIGAAMVNANREQYRELL